MMQQLMNSPMVQQMMSNPETGSEGSEIRIFFFFCFNRWPGGDYFDVEKEDFLPIPPKKRRAKKKEFHSNETHRTSRFICFRDFPCIKTY